MLPPHRLLAGLLLLVCMTTATAAPTPAEPPRKAPDPETLQRVRARQQELQKVAEALHLASFQKQPIPDELRKRVEDAFAAWKRDLASADDPVYLPAAQDFENGYLRNFPADRVADALLALLKKPDLKSLDRLAAQGRLMEALARYSPTEAKRALPDFLVFVADDKVPAYLRGQAIEAAARTAPGDRQVVKVFIRALENPNPKDTSGVHDRIAEKLGDMGPSAADAKPALRKLLARGSWASDAAYIALGKLSRDEPARPLQDYLDRLGQIDRYSEEEIAAAFLQVQALCHPGSPIIGSNVSFVFTFEKLDRERAAKARPVLWQVAEQHRDDVHARAALRALLAIQPGSSAEAARILTRNLDLKWTPDNGGWVTDLSTRLLAQFAPTDPAAIPVFAEAFGRQFANRDQYPIPRELALLLAKYGKQARPVAPYALRAVSEFVVDPNPNSARIEVFASYVRLLATLGPEVPRTRATVLDLLDPKGPLLTRAGAAAPAYHFELLQALHTLGLPADGAERRQSLERLREALDAGSPAVFSMGALIVAKEAASLTEAEAKPLVPLLARVLAADFRFRDTVSRITLRADSALTATPRLLGPGPALEALAALGPKAREAEAAVKAVADRPLKPWKAPAFTKEPPENHLIRAAGKALEAMRSGTGSK
jgi:hypothetical protein